VRKENKKVERKPSSLIVRRESIGNNSKPQIYSMTAMREAANKVLPPAYRGRKGF